MTLAFNAKLALMYWQDRVSFTQGDIRGCCKRNLCNVEKEKFSPTGVYKTHRTQKKNIDAHQDLWLIMVSQDLLIKIPHNVVILYF